jgi:hypothetical protein
MQGFICNLEKGEPNGSPFLFKLVSNLVIDFQLGYHSFQLGYL